MRVPTIRLGIGSVATMIAVLGGTAGGHGATVNAVSAPVQTIPAITTHETFGDMMEGMEVSVAFDNSPIESEIWMATGNPGEGQAKGIDGDWSLTEAGDTFSSIWTLEYTALKDKGTLTGFSIDGFAAGVSVFGVMFDRTRDGSGDLVGTPGSEKGRDFDEIGAPPFSIFVTYRGAVGVDPNAPLEDLYRWMDVVFRDPLGQTGGLNGDNITTLEFLQDTDNPKIVPEPTSLALLMIGAGLMGLLAYARRRRRS